MLLQCNCDARAILLFEPAFVPLVLLTHGHQALVPLNHRRAPTSRLWFSCLVLATKVMSGR